jgi:RND family efflux transporter MFP subunit
MRKTLPIICVALLLFCMGCKDKVKSGSAEVKRQPVNGVTVWRVPLSQVDAYYETSGTVKAKTTSIVASRVMGTVTGVRVKIGDRVKAGDLLMTIDDRDMVQKVGGAEAGHREALKAREAAEQGKKLADITYERYKQLYDQKAVTGQEMDQIEAQKKVSDLEHERTNETVNRAKAALDEARIHQGFTRIVAPVSGIVTEKKIEQGSMVIPGMPLATVEDTSQFKVEAFIDERLAGKLKAGMPAYVVLDSTGDGIQGAIGEISSAIDPSSRTYLINIYLKGQSLRTGLYVKVLIPEGRKEAVLVPAKAVVERGQLTGMYVVDDSDVITYRLIRTGRRYEQNLEVLSGLMSGERIITVGTEKAVDGGILKQ